MPETPETKYMIDTDHNQQLVSGDQPDESALSAAVRKLERAKVDHSVTCEMPRYKCHKEVWALKIKEVKQAPSDQECMHPGGDYYLVPEEATFAPVCVGHEFVQKHKPEAGGYYVVYHDGYKSFSPAKPFEDGYTRI